MGLSLGHMIVVLLVVLLLFGSRLPKVMGDLGRGMRNFREGLDGDEKKQEVLPPKDKE